MNYFKLVTSVVVLLSVVSTFGCARSAHSPPTRQVITDSVKTAEVGTVPLKASVFAGMDDDLAFGYSVTGAEVGARTGLTKNLETSLSTSVMEVHGGDDEKVDLNPYIWSMRAGLKYNPEVTRSFFSVMGGAGTGYSEGGLFVGPDVGVVLGYENSILVPFLSASVMLSFPVAPNEVNLVNQYDHSYDVEPWTSMTTSVATGLKVPLESLSMNIIAVFPQISSVSKIDDSEADEMYHEHDIILAGSLGIEAVFGG